MSYQSLDYYNAISHGCTTIEDVETAELIGVLPGGSTNELQDLFPTRRELKEQEILRDYLWVEHEYITESQLSDSYDYPDLLQRFLSKQEPEVIADYYLGYLPNRIAAEFIYDDESDEDDDD